MASEVFKAITHGGGEPRLCHYRAAGTKVDLIADVGHRLILAEARSGGTVAARFFQTGMRTLGEALEKTGLTVERRLVCGGDLHQQRGGAEVVPWNRMLERTWS
ncbi:hypothetical protein [Candidatus Palauibacter sp.]|uniref:hypothetical protein n=1 Tax=Candidatus Palauibacter sp. TaxID=3101350 RepID=UPI003AF294EE